VASRLPPSSDLSPGRGFALLVQICRKLSSVGCWARMGRGTSAWRWQTGRIGIRCGACLAEFAAYLSSILELKQDCVAGRGSLFILPGGVEVRVPLTSPLTGLAAAFLGALALLLIGRPARIEFFVTLFRQDLIIIGLNIVGVIALLDIPFMAFRIASIPNKK
jgi:hypothetical protein